MINRIAALDAPPSGQKLLPDYRRRPGEPHSVGWAGGWGERVGALIGEHPAVALAVGLTVGIVVGCLLKRR